MHTLAGSGSATHADGTGAAASFSKPRGVAVSPSGTHLFVGDHNNHRIRQVVIATGVVTTIAGSGSATHADGTGAVASFNYPNGVAVSPSGTHLFVGDTYNNRIRQVVIATGVVTTIAGSGSASYADGTGAAAGFNELNGVAVSPDDSTLYVIDANNRRIRKVVE